MNSTVASRAALAISTPTLPTLFTSCMRSEWTKLRTLSSTIWALAFTLVSMIGLGALLTSLEVSKWDTRTVKEAAGFDPLLYSLAGVNLAQLSIGVLGVLVMTSEYATRSIALTFSATPQRRLVLAAKVATFSIVSGVVAVVSCTTSFLLGQAILGPSHGGVSLTDPGVLRALVGAAAYFVFIGAIGIGLGAALRHTAGAVSLLFGVLLVVPGLVMLLPEPWNNNVTKYLPGAAGEAMSAVTRFPNLLTPGPGLVVLTGWTGGVLLTAGLVLGRRDA